jgi:tetratricopeptide (TPR) repeat protein
LISTARQWQQAIEPYRRTIELDPYVALVHDNLGIALEEIGDHDQAIEEHVKARSVSGNDNFRPEALRSASQSMACEVSAKSNRSLPWNTGLDGAYMLFRSHRSTQDWPIPLWQWRGYKRPLTLDQGC